MQYSAGSGIKLMLTPLQTKYTPSGQLRSATPQHLLRNGSENMTKKMLIPIRLSMSVTCQNNSYLWRPHRGWVFLDPWWCGHRTSGGLVVFRAMATDHLIPVLCESSPPFVSDLFWFAHGCLTRLWSWEFGDYSFSLFQVTQAVPEQFLQCVRVIIILGVHCHQAEHTVCNSV